MIFPLGMMRNMMYMILSGVIFKQWIYLRIEKFEIVDYHSSLIYPGRRHKTFPVIVQIKGICFLNCFFFPRVQ